MYYPNECPVCGGSLNDFDCIDVNLRIREFLDSFNKIGVLLNLLSKITELGLELTKEDKYILQEKLLSIFINSGIKMEIGDF